MQKEKNEVSKRISQENNGGLPKENGRVEENADRLKERSRTHEVAYLTVNAYIKEIANTID